jgi:hypothetical protein
MKLGEKGNVHHTVSKGRIPNILEEVDEAEKHGKAGGTKKVWGISRTVLKISEVQMWGTVSPSNK